MERGYSPFPHHFILFYFFILDPSMWDLGFLTGEKTWAPYSESMES